MRGIYSDAESHSLQLCDILGFSLHKASNLVKEGIEGNTLVLTKLTRADGGAYLCIAQNGVPSPVSKRIMVHVHCKSTL